MCPIVNVSPDVRYPVLGATYQPRGGIAKHDYVAWGFARAAARAGRRPDPALRGHRASTPAAGGSPGCGPPGAPSPPTRWRCAPPGTPACSPRWPVWPLPLQSHPLQALVSELLEPVAPDRGDVQRGARLRQPGAQGRAGDGRRASTRTTPTASAARCTSSSAQMAAALELFPIFARAHVLRTWGGIVDVSPDASPIIGLTPVDGLFLNCGWGTGGFKATPGRRLVLRRTPSRNGRPHPLARAVHAGPVHHRRAGRRARRRRRGALREADAMLLIACPWCGPRDEDEFHYGGQAGVAYPADPAALSRRAMGALPVLPGQPQGRRSPSAGPTPPAAGAGSALVRDTATNEILRGSRHRGEAAGDEPAVTPRGPVDRSQPAHGSRFDGRELTRPTPATRSPRRCWRPACTRSPAASTSAARAASSPRAARSRPRWSRCARRYPEPMLTATTVELFDGLVADAVARPGLAGRPSRTRPATTRLRALRRAGRRRRTGRAGGRARRAAGPGCG